MIGIMFWRLVVGKKPRIIGEKTGIPAAQVAKKLQQLHTLRPYAVLAVLLVIIGLLF